MQDATLKIRPEPAKGRAMISKIKQLSGATAAARLTRGYPEAGPTTPCHPAAPTLDADPAGFSSDTSVQGSEPILPMELDLN